MSLCVYRRYRMERCTETLRNLMKTTKANCKRDNPIITAATDWMAYDLFRSVSTSMVMPVPPLHAGFNVNFLFFCH